jgi:hypothetical protein
MKRVLEGRGDAERVAGEDELVRLGHRNLETEMAQVDAQRLGARLVPEVIERQPVDEHAEGAEGMPEAVAGSQPIDEADGQLDRPLRVADEVLQVDPEEPQEVDDARDRRFAHADRRYVGRLDELNRAPVTHLPGQRACRDPAGRAAADDGNALDATISLHTTLLDTVAERGTGQSAEAKGGDRRQPTAPCHTNACSEAAAQT